MEPHLFRKLVLERLRLPLMMTEVCVRVRSQVGHLRQTSGSVCQDRKAAREGSWPRTFSDNSQDEHVASRHEPVCLPSMRGQSRSWQTGFLLPARQ